MKKKKKNYVRPEIEIINCDVESYVLGSSGNQATGTIHTDDGDVIIGSGSEDDGEGTEASAKRFYPVGDDW